MKTYIDIIEYYKMATNDLIESKLRYDEKKYSYSIWFLALATEKLYKIIATMIGYTQEELIENVSHNTVHISKKIIHDSIKQELQPLYMLSKSNPKIKKFLKDLNINIKQELKHHKQLLHLPVNKQKYNKMSDYEIIEHLLKVNSVHNIENSLNKVEMIGNGIEKYKDSIKKIEPSDLKFIIDILTDGLKLKFNDEELKEIHKILYNIFNSHEFEKYIFKMIETMFDLKYFIDNILFVSPLIQIHNQISRYNESIYTENLPIVKKFPDLLNVQISFLRKIVDFRQNIVESRIYYDDCIYKTNKMFENIYSTSLKEGLFKGKLE